jgi:D-alanyl-D-alanine carboxypeptidase/D-alanyl-D-alanine-endopeptidase (penicillin-binding protein 4)
MLPESSDLSRACVLALLLASACAGSTAPAAVQPVPFDFARTADSIVSMPPLDRGHFGIEVYDPAAKRILYAYNSERRFVPASNQKLWPTATALHELGADFRYRTPVLALGFDATTRTAQALVVVGRGDPTLSARFHGGDHVVLEWLADSVRAAGVERITGDVIVDASYFDAAIVPGTWTFGNLNGASAPPTGAFVVAEGLFRLRVRAGAGAGAPAAIEAAAPRDVVPVLNRATTVAAGERAATARARGPWSDTLRITGTIAVGDSQTVRLPMTDPVRFAAHAFADALRARGIALDGTVRFVYDAEAAAALRGGAVNHGTAPVAVRELTVWTSPPLGDIVAAILGPSQNWIAEQLLRTLGAEKGDAGSWSAGVAVERRFLFDVVGIDSAALRLNDGSGMSNQNLVTPHAIVQLLDYARTAEWGPVFRAALAKPATPGTLSNRLRGLEGRLEGKTGTLNSVNALSGYLRTRDGRELIFSILSNASGLPSAPVVAAIDKLVTSLAQERMPR